MHGADFSTASSSILQIHPIVLQQLTRSLQVIVMKPVGTTTLKQLIYQENKAVGRVLNRKESIFYEYNSQLTFYF